MKTISMWSYSSGAREIDIHDVEPELFEKLRPAFDVTDCSTADVCRISFDANAKIIFYKKKEYNVKEAGSENAVENAENA